MSSPDLGKIFGQARAMQSRMAEIQRDLSRRRFEGSAGGGMVTAVCSGDLKLIELQIEPALHADGDREMLQDLATAAVNSALANAQRGAQEEMQRASGGLDLGSLFSPSGSTSE